MDSMKWHIGQRIIAIKDHSQGRFKKGDEFTIKGLKASNCKCKNILIDIGKGGNAKTQSCLICSLVVKCDGVYWYSEKCYSPQLTNYQTTQSKA